MNVGRLLIVVIGALVAYRALASAALARGHRRVGDFVGWIVVAVVAVLAALGAIFVGR